MDERSLEELKSIRILSKKRESWWSHHREITKKGHKENYFLSVSWDREKSRKEVKPWIESLEPGEVG